MISSIEDIIYKLPNELPNDLSPLVGPLCPHKKKKFRILGNQEILKKFQKWVEAEPSTQSPSRNKILLELRKNYAKIDIKVFSSCPISRDFLTLFHKFCFIDCFTFRSTCSQMFFKIGAFLKISQYWQFGVILIKLFSCKYCKIFNNIFLIEQLWQLLLHLCVTRYSFTLHKK